MNISSEKLNKTIKKDIKETPIDISDDYTKDSEGNLRRTVILKDGSAGLYSPKEEIEANKAILENFDEHN